MKAKLFSMLAIVVSALSLTSCYAQSYGYNDRDYDNNYSYGNGRKNVTVQAESQDISYNLDLRAVANLFADSRDLEEFEMRLNDFESGINNLDMNQDGQVDYLRVIETSKRNSHLVVIQAILDRDVFQDVATIVVEKKYNSRTYVQVIGDPYLYGPYYIIEPVYVYTPSIFSFFWGPRYHRWYSPYYWGYYPSYWHYWNPYPVYTYVNNINIYLGKHNHKYNYTDRIRSNYYNDMHRQLSRNDYQRSNPDRSFSNRNANVNNRRDLGEVRSNRANINDNNSRSSVNRNSENTSRSRSSATDVRTDRDNVRTPTGVNGSRSTRSTQDWNNRNNNSVSPARSSGTTNDRPVRGTRTQENTIERNSSQGGDVRSNSILRLPAVGTTQQGSVG